MINSCFKVGIYLRLSSEDDNKDESQSISNQREFIMSYIKSNKLVIVDEYIDDGVTGTSFDRKGFNRLIEDIENKRINMVVTKDSSRLGRNISQSLYYTTEYFQERNVRFVAINDCIDTFDKTQNTDMLLFKSFYNEMYVKDISQKIKATLYTQKKNGKFMGGNPPYGYDRNLPYNKHELVINQEQAKVVKKIFNLFLEGYSVRKIVEYLYLNNIPIPSIQKKLNRGVKSSIYGVWHENVIRNILCNPTYKGDLVQSREYKISYKSSKRRKNKKEDWVIAYNACPAIIDSDMFDLVQNIYSKSKNRTLNSRQYLFRGFLFCYECGHSISINHLTWKSNGVNKYRNICYCNYYKKFSKYNVCSPHKIDYDELERIILKDIKDKFDLYLDKGRLEKYLISNSIIKSEQNNLETMIINDSNSIKEYEMYIDKLYKEKLGGLISDEFFKRQYNLFNNKIINFKSNIDNMRKKLEYIKSNDVGFQYKNILDDFLTFNKPNKRLLSSIIDKIFIDKNNDIYINYKIKLN